MRNRLFKYNEKSCSMKHLKIFMLASLSLSLGLVSCSSEADDPIATGEDNVIRFTAASPQAQDRASTDITTSNLKQFFVYGYLASDLSPYMSNDEVNKTGTNLWEYSPVKYWPSGDAVNFYAYAPANMLPSGVTPLDKIAFTNDGYTDFIYAVSPDMTQPASGSNAQVKFNFRHALAKVTVMLSSTDTKLKVRVNNVTIVGVNKNGDFEFPSSSTAENPGSAAASSIGTWSNLSGRSIAVLHMAQRQNEILTLTSQPIDADTDGNSIKFFIPQELPFVQGGDYDNEVYLLMTCAIYDNATGTKVWPNANTPEENLSNMGAEGVIHLSLQGPSFTAWQGGYHYVYNVVINGHPDMSQIEFGDPSVDSYVTVTTQLQP